MSTPHIKAQIQVDAGASARASRRAWRPGPIACGPWKPGPECDIEFAGGGFPEVIVADGERGSRRACRSGPARADQSPRHDRVFIIEDRSWVRDCLTADRVTALQAFRDLFSGDVLRPGDEVSIGQVTLMFTDLKGSTALYERIGDARPPIIWCAITFAFLAEQVRDHNGAIVKTIGDAVMAAFADPLGCGEGSARHPGPRGAVSTASMTAKRDIAIKLGLHKGPCIAVTLNERSIISAARSTWRRACRAAARAAISCSRRPWPKTRVSKRSSGLWRQARKPPRYGGFYRPGAPCFRRLKPACDFDGHGGYSPRA